MIGTQSMFLHAMQLNPLFNHQPEAQEHVVVVVEHTVGVGVIPTISTKWSCIMFCAMLCVDIIVMLIAYLLTDSFENWFAYLMAGNAVCILLLVLIAMIDCIVLSCRRKN